LPADPRLQLFIVAFSDDMRLSGFGYQQTLPPAPLSPGLHPLGAGGDANGKVIALTFEQRGQICAASDIELRD
jgi:hypothetical protein